MATWRNTAGYPLSSPAWLAIHHQAKLRERTRFAESLAQYRPTRLVDLGCATGLWLNLLDAALPPDCHFIGIDNDPESLEIAHEHARSWSRTSQFIHCDITKAHDEIPDADLALAFNIFPYISSPAELLKHLHRDDRIGRTVVRQYDGGTMRIGPIPSDDRLMIEASLQTSLMASAEYSHYDLDRAYAAIRGSGLEIERCNFELIERHAPFAKDFAEYFDGTVEWMSDHVSEDARERLNQALVKGAAPEGSLYFAEVDLVAVLSAAS